jgi:hypothetical protein
MVAWRWLARMQTQGRMVSFFETPPLFVTPAKAGVHAAARG